MSSIGERPRIGEDVYIAPTAYVGGDVVIGDAVRSYVEIGRQHATGRFPNIAVS